MTFSPKSFQTLALVSTTAAATLFAGIGGAAADSSVKLLTAHFDTRNVVQIEAGEFHFEPGQVAPIHTHSAPAVGYVAKGSIIYQVEGEAPQVLHEGAAFYEPVDQRILRFDNLSATEEAIFIDFNLEQEGEPFIVFEEQPTEAIDRRALPTIDIADQSVSRVEISNHSLEPNGSFDLVNEDSSLFYVAEGIVELKGTETQTVRLIAGQTFAGSPDTREVSVSNASSDVPAELVIFRLN